MNIVKVILSSLCLFYIPVESIAQRMTTLSRGVSGNKTFIFTDGRSTVRPKVGQPTVDGQPYVHDVWMKGKVFFENGFVKEVERLNYDALDNMLIQFEDGIELEFVAPVKSFHLYIDDASRMNFWMVEGKFYEVLYEGVAILLKRHKKEIQIASRYSGAWASGAIVSKNELFILDHAYKLNKVKKGAEFFKMFDADQKQLQSFVKKQRLNMKSEQDLIKLIQYSSTLKK